jgi:hypothetical protein
MKGYFWGFFGVVSWTFIIINLSMMPKTNQGKKKLGEKYIF